MFSNTLIQIMCEMIEISYSIQIQMINTKGLLAISYHLEKVFHFKFNPFLSNSTTFVLKFAKFRILNLIFGKVYCNFWVFQNPGNENFSFLFLKIS